MKTLDYLLIIATLFSTIAIQLGAAERPNFILILSDDQSWVGTSALMDPDNPKSKSDYYKTPYIERLASQGMRFTDGYSPAPYCCPTRRSLQIGQTPAKHVYQKDMKGWPAAYRKQLTIPRMLKGIDKRYQAAHFGKWDLRFDEVTPKELGYDVSDGATGNGEGGSKGSGGPAPKDDPKLIDHITKEGCMFMEKQAAAGNPFYLQISHYAVHLDIYYRKETLKRVSKRKRGKQHKMPEFAAMTEDLDGGIGRLLDKVKELKLEGNTYVFFMSDNGGRLKMPKAPKSKIPRNDPLRDGKGKMYEGGLRVPFIVMGPGIKANSVCRTPVTGLDIYPTMADLAGRTSPLPSALDGGSIKSLLLNAGTGSVTRKHDFLIFHQAITRTAQSALRKGNLKLVKTWKEKKLELFDLSKDLGEKKDLSRSMPEKTKELHRLMVGFLENVGAETRKTMSKAELKKLYK